MIHRSLLCHNSTATASCSCHPQAPAVLSLQNQGPAPSPVTSVGWRASQDSEAAAWPPLQKEKGLPCVQHRWPLTPSS